jgi:hypothetical protein
MALFLSQNLREKHKPKSLRKYLSILYAVPKMKIHLLDRVVESKYMVYTLYKPCEFVTSRKFKSSISESIKKHDSMIEQAKEAIRLTSTEKE